MLYLTAAGIRRGMEKMQRAFEIYPYCAMALNYLANHFFYTGQHFLVEQLTETALAVTNHGPTKSHSYYNLARSYHSKVRKRLCLLLLFCLWRGHFFLVILRGPLHFLYCVILNFEAEEVVFYTITCFLATSACVFKCGWSSIIDLS